MPTRRKKSVNNEKLSSPLKDRASVECSLFRRNATLKNLRFYLFLYTLRCLACICQKIYLATNSCERTHTVV